MSLYNEANNPDNFRVFRVFGVFSGKWLLTLHLNNLPPHADEVTIHNPGEQYAQSLFRELLAGSCEY
jgi:hypothetical protein